MTEPISSAIRIRDLIRSPVLVTRGSARSLSELLSKAPLAEEYVLDFAGIEGITPSFMDELLAVLAELQEARSTSLRIHVLSPPTRLTSKFQAVGRSHNLEVTELREDHWLMVYSRPASA